jgi:hypothetical protein
MKISPFGRNDKNALINFIIYLLSKLPKSKIGIWDFHDWNLKTKDCTSSFFVPEFFHHQDIHQMSCNDR